MRKEYIIQLLEVWKTIMECRCCNTRELIDFLGTLIVESVGELMAAKQISSNR